MLVIFWSLRTAYPQISPGISRSRPSHSVSSSKNTKVVSVYWNLSKKSTGELPLEGTTTIVSAFRYFVYTAPWVNSRCVSHNHTSWFQQCGSEREGLVCSEGDEDMGVCVDP